jgi:RNA polymerase sigma factor (TIGR02999 family)
LRNILVDQARARHTAARGGEVRRMALDGLEIGSPAMDEKVLALEEALSRLSEWDPRQAKVVELRFFGGLTAAETAEVLNAKGVESSLRTVERDWTFARAWLLHAIRSR